MNTAPAPTIAQDINTLAAYLAVAAERTTPLPPLDCAFLYGNACIQTACYAFEKLKNNAFPYMVIAGGIGHSTPLLYAAIQAHPVYHTIPTAGRSEAAIFADIGTQFYGLSPDLFLLDTLSFHTGENALFAREALEKAGRTPHNIQIIQDPTLQRRSIETTRHVFRDQSHVRFFNGHAFAPAVTEHGDALVFADPHSAAAWTMDRFLSLILGEIPRLRDDATGYGPKGQHFLGHIDIPPAVTDAFARLSQSALFQHNTRRIA